jgi:hypothetical protein
VGNDPEVMISWAKSERQVKYYGLLEISQQTEFPTRPIYRPRRPHILAGRFFFRLVSSGLIFKNKIIADSISNSPQKMQILYKV